MAILEHNVARLDTSHEDQGPDVTPLVSQVEDAELKKKDIFPFFKLPRELRDKVYADVTIDAWVRLERSIREGFYGYQCASFQCAPSTRHSAINRQFRLEYLKEMARPSTRATLIVNLNYLVELCRHPRPPLRRALSRVHTVIWTYGWTDLYCPRVKPRHHDEHGFQRMFRLLPSLSHLKLVFYDTSWDLVMPSSQWMSYCHANCEPRNIRRLLTDSLGRTLLDSIEISSSTTLSGRLFETHNYLTVGDKLTESPINRVLYHVPASLDPNDLDLASLEFDEAESKRFEEVQTHCQHSWKLSRENRNHMSKVFVAGYRMKFEP